MNRIPWVHNTENNQWVCACYRKGWDHLFENTVAYKKYSHIAFESCSSVKAQDTSSEYCRYVKNI